MLVENDKGGLNGFLLLLSKVWRVTLSGWRLSLHGRVQFGIVNGFD